MEKYKNIAETIEGWFKWDEIIPVLEILNNNQNFGNILEIGVHHGKSFIPMILLLKENEIAIAVDVFEDQQFNYDGSGKGSSIKLNENIKKVFDNENIFNKIKIIKEDSTKLNNNDYLCYSNNVKYRIISIDGCHTQHATLIDLWNATKILTEDGIIILDDYFNNSWPGVKFGIDKFMEENNCYRLIYLNANKFILCHKKYYDKYIKLLKKISNNRAIKYESRCWNGEVWKK